MLYSSNTRKFYFEIIDAILYFLLTLSFENDFIVHRKIVTILHVTQRVIMPNLNEKPTAAHKNGSLHLTIYVILEIQHNLILHDDNMKN